MEHDTEEPLPGQCELPEASYSPEPDRVPGMLDALEPDEMPDVREAPDVQDAPDAQDALDVQDALDADEAVENDVRSAGPRQATGEPRVNDALRKLDQLAELPVSEHPAVFEQVHARLRDVLGELDSGAAAGAQGRQGS